MRYLAVIVVCLAGLAGCGNPFEFGPETTAILKVEGIADDAAKERIAESAKELVLENSTWHMIQTSEHNGRVMIKVSPVEDVQGYADRITFGKVTSVDGNTIQVAIQE